MNRELLEQAYAIIDGIPEERINLKNWQLGLKKITSAREINCGTIACAAGWLSLHPAMNERGLYAGLGGTPTFGSSDHYGALAKFFGITFGQAHDLFYPNMGGGGDKQVFLNRLRALLKENEA